MLAWISDDYFESFLLPQLCLWELKTTKKATTTLKTTVKKQKVVAMKRPPFFTLKVSVNIVRTLMCTGHWSWNVLNAFGTISTRFVLYAITRSPRRELHQRELSSISRLRSSYTQKREDVGNQFLFPFLRGEQRRGLINFHPFQMAMALLFLSLFFKNFLKRYLLSDMILSRAFNSRVFQLILVQLFYVFIAFIIISQVLSWGFSCRTNLYATVGLRTRIVNWLTVRELLRLW